MVCDLGLGTRQHSSIRGGMLHIRVLVFMLHTYACVHVAVRVRGLSTFMGGSTSTFMNYG